jgi:hypothetical protein
MMIGRKGCRKVVDIFFETGTRYDLLRGPHP